MMTASPAARQLTRLGLPMSSHMLYSVTRTTTKNLQGLSIFARHAHAQTGYDRGEKWPHEGVNTILNVVPQGSRAVMERLGKFHSVKEPGWFLAIPVVDRIRYIVDMREKAIEIAPQAAITKDNVSVDVSGNVYVKFVDAHKAAYGSFNPLYAVYQHAQASMRAAIGNMDLDEILHARSQINAEVCTSLQQAAESWGLYILRYEITEITPDQEIQRAMDKQAVAERDRRELVLTAEGQKRYEVLASEAVKVQLQNESEGELIKIRNEALAMKDRLILESEGDLIKIRNEALATKDRLILEAEGEAEAVMKKAEAQTKALSIVSQALATTEGAQAAQLELARDYVQMYGQMGSTSNTMLFMDKPGDVAGLIAQAATVFKQTTK